MSIKRGEIWLANLDPTIGSEINKTRPVVVVSNNINNNYNSVITILPISSNNQNVFDFEVFLPKGEANLPKNSKVKADQIRSIDKRRLYKKLGVINSDNSKKIDIAIKLHLNL